MSIVINQAAKPSAISSMARSGPALAKTSAHHVVPNLNALHQANSKKPIIKFDHLSEYFGSADGEPVGKTKLLDKTTGQNIDVNVVRVIKGDEELYKLVHNGEVIAFAEIKVDLEDKEKGPKVVLEFTAAKYPHRYARVLDSVNKIILEHMQQVEATEKIKFNGMELHTSWNSGQVYLNQGLHLEDRTGLDAISGRKCDKAIKKRINEAGSAEKAITKDLGCTTVYLPWSGRRKFKKLMKKNPVFDANNFDNGKVQLTKNDGTKVDAQVTRVHDASTGMDVYKISAGGKELGSIQLNYMKLNADGKVNDYCGNYDKASPFSQYGNGYFFGWFGAKKPKSKVFVEIHETLTQEFKDLNQALMRIPTEIAYKKEEFGGRVMLEADWNEHATAYELGFRTQKYRGLTKAVDLEQAYKTEIDAAKKEGRVANLKQYGSQKMYITKAEMLEKFSNGPAILSPN